MARVGDFVASLQERPLPGRCQIAACKAFEGVAIFDGVCNLVGLFAGGGGVCAQAKSPGEHPQREGCDGRGGQWRWVWAARAQVWRGQMISPWWSPRWGIRPATA